MHQECNEGLQKLRVNHKYTCMHTYAHTYTCTHIHMHTHSDTILLAVQISVISVMHCQYQRYSVL